jgi:putative FmdB family regulatory protein
MPHYAFKCKNCNEELVETCEYEDLPATFQCPKCFLTMVRDFKFGSIQFKGTGFYLTDKKDTGAKPQ